MSKKPQHWKVKLGDLNKFIDKKKKLDDDYFQFEADQAAALKSAQSEYLTAVNILQEDLRFQAGVPDDVDDVELRGSRFVEVVEKK